MCIKKNDAHQIKLIQNNFHDGRNAAGTFPSMCI